MKAKKNNCIIPISNTLNGEETAISGYSYAHKMFKLKAYASGRALKDKYLLQCRQLFYKAQLRNKQPPLRYRTSINLKEQSEITKRFMEGDYND